MRFNQLIRNRVLDANSTTPIDTEKRAGVNRFLVGSPERSRGLLARRSRQNTALAPLPPSPYGMSSRRSLRFGRQATHRTRRRINANESMPTNTADESLRLSASRPSRRTSHHGTQRRLRHDASSCPGLPEPKPRRFIVPSRTPLSVTNTASQPDDTADQSLPMEHFVVVPSPS